MANILASQLRLLRREKKLTQGDMARVILVPRVTYTHYELGKRTPDLDTIILLARFHEVSVDFLLGNAQMRPTLDNWLSSNKFQSDSTGPDNGYTIESAQGNLVADQPLSDN
jgi:transcriptional regulator with XRE-family HTH domain